MKKLILAIALSFALVLLPFLSRAEETEGNTETAFSVTITSDPKPVESSPGFLEVNITPDQTILFTPTVDDQGMEYSWKWNFAEYHLNCNPYPFSKSPELKCTPLSKGTSVVSVSMFPQSEVGNAPAVESNQIYVKVEEKDDTPPEFCTEEYAPVGGEIQIQCITTPCNPVWETFPNRCYAERAGALEIREGACAGDAELPPATYQDDVMSFFKGYKNPFPDTDLEKLSGQAAAEMYRRDIMTGYPDGEFKGKKPVNRAEVTKILPKLQNLPIPELRNNGMFSDVPDDSWFTSYVMSAVEGGWVNGHPDGTFRPAETVNTAEFLKMFVLSLNLKERLEFSYRDVAYEDWFAPYAGIAEEFKLFPDRTEFLQPDDQLSREDIAIAMYQYLKYRNQYGPEGMSRCTYDLQENGEPIFACP